MSKKEIIEQKAEALLQPITEACGFEIVDVEYVKEGSERILRAYIDKPGGIKIEDCETVSRSFSDALDAENLIDEAYTLEVSSPGLLRPLRKDKDFARNMGKELELHLFKDENGAKDFMGTLQAYDAETVTLQIEDSALSFRRENISLLRPYIDFSELLK